MVSRWPLSQRSRGRGLTHGAICRQFPSKDALAAAAIAADFDKILALFKVQVAFSDGLPRNLATFAALSLIADKADAVG